MGNPGPQHKLVGVLVGLHPELAPELAERQVSTAHLGGKREALVTYFFAMKTPLHPHALAKVEAASDELVIQSWLMRAYSGESPDQIFGPPPANDPAQDSAKD